MAAALHASAKGRRRLRRRRRGSRRRKKRRLRRPAGAARLVSAPLVSVQEAYLTAFAWHDALPYGCILRAGEPSVHV